jgi:hypothetical protein
MGQPIPAQHPSVVLRSHFKLVRTLLAIAMAAVIGLAAAVVILANDDDQISTATNAPAVQQSQPAGTRYDGGPEEGSRALSPPAEVAPPAPSLAAAGSGTAYENLRSSGSRYDGGPEEGTRGPVHTQFKERSGGPTSLQGGPGAR